MKVQSSFFSERSKNVAMATSLGTNRRKWPAPSSFPGLVFQNGLEDHNADAKTQ